jgi:hypothetical protein
MANAALARRVLATHSVRTIDASGRSARGRMRAQGRDEQRGKTKSPGKSHAKGWLSEARLKWIHKKAEAGPIHDVA